MADWPDWATVGHDPWFIPKRDKRGAEAPHKSFGRVKPTDINRDIYTNRPARQSAHSLSTYTYLKSSREHRHSKILGAPFDFESENWDSLFFNWGHVCVCQSDRGSFPNPHLENFNSWYDPLHMIGVFVALRSILLPSRCSLLVSSEAINIAADDWIRTSCRVTNRPDR